MSPCNHLGRRLATRDFSRSRLAAHAPQAKAALFKQRQQPSADVAGAAGQKNGGTVTGHGRPAP